MKQLMGGILVSGAILVLAGCATARPGSGSLETRVQSLENRLQVIEADVQSSTGRGSMDTGMSSDAGSPDFGATVETMTKKQIQKALKSAGYYDGDIDGKIGPKTREAITQFQQDMGLKADGVAGRKTKEKLLKYLS